MTRARIADALHALTLIMGVMCLVVFLVLTFGCSNVKAIGKAAGYINDHAAAIEGLQGEIVGEASKIEPNNAAIIAAASQSKSHASSIRSEVNTVTQNLGGTTDEHSPWAKALLWAAIAAAFAVVAVVLWRCGLDKACYAILSWLPVRTKARDLAEADADVLQVLEKRPNVAGIEVAQLATKRELIAKKRAKSKHYEAEFKAARKRQK